MSKMHISNDDGNIIKGVYKFGILLFYFKLTQTKICLLNSYVEFMTTQSGVNILGNLRHGPLVTK